MNDTPDVEVLCCPLCSIDDILTYLKTSTLRTIYLDGENSVCVPKNTLRRLTSLLELLVAPAGGEA